MRELEGDGLEVSDAGSDVTISGARFDDPDLPEVSLSPAMTLYGPWSKHVEECS